MFEILEEVALKTPMKKTGANLILWRDELWVSLF
jgi:hypothetical protein